MPHQTLVPHLVKSNLQQLIGGWWHGPLEKLSVVVPSYAMVHSSLQAKDNLQPSQNGRMLHDQIYQLDKPYQTITNPRSSSQRGPFFFKKHVEQLKFYDNWHTKLARSWLPMDAPRGNCAPLQTFQGFIWNWIRTWLCTEDHGAVERFECPRFCGNHQNGIKYDNHDIKLGLESHWIVSKPQRSQIWPVCM